VASTIGLKVGDQIISIDGQTFVSTDEMTSYIRNDADGLLNLQIKRVDEELFLSADLSGQSEKILGVYLTEVGLVRYHGMRRLFRDSRLLFLFFGRLLCFLSFT
jgi:PDZ domain-containing secreted protein